MEKRKREIDRRLALPLKGEHERPMFSTGTVHYELDGRRTGMNHGGIAGIHLMVQKLGLAAAIDKELELLKIHQPYHESDHVLNIAYNTLCGGTCLGDLELLRTDEGYLRTLDAERIPDPTTAGDFCRRFDQEAIETLQCVFDTIRLKVWARQPKSFRREAVMDFDGSIVPTTGERKEGMDISYDGQWGYHPLIVSLANTNEVLRIVNRSGNRPSHEGAAAEADKMIALCRKAGFRRILLRGDTDFSQTKHLDRWDEENVTFHFGYDSVETLQRTADELPENAWKRLDRPARYKVRTKPRRRRKNVKEQIVVERGYKNKKLRCEHVAEFDYRPTACRKTNRMIVIRKNISVERGETALFDKTVYLFYITNDRKRSAAEVVFSCNDRCHQENLIEQQKNGVRSLRAPVDNLESNWAYMVMASLAWNLKAWWALLLPETGRWADKHREEKKAVLRMEFKTFVNAFVHIPCDVIRTGRQLICRLLSWNPWQGVFFRFLDVLRC